MESGADGEDADGGDADGAETQMQQCARTRARSTAEDADGPEMQMQQCARTRARRMAEDADGPEPQLQQCANTFERWTTLVLPAPPAGELGSMGCQQHFFPIRPLSHVLVGNGGIETSLLS